jgi:uncharacterized protein YdeI (YjbR/CyaY-like superfamily)
VQPRFFRTPAEFRRWLESHHTQASELPVGLVKKGSRRPGITYAQALDEALCFGWIDGVTHGVDDERYVVRFTPRRRGSNWSARNVGHVRRLIAEGRIQPEGLAAFERRGEGRASANSIERETAAFDQAAERRFRANRAAWRFWHGQPAGYVKTATWWVMSAKREETRTRRLAALIDHSARGERVPQVTGVATRR